GKIKSSLKAAQKEEILRSLGDRGLIETEIKIKRTKAEVWLTERGIELLRDEYTPKKGTNPTLSLDLLNNYLRFLRKTLPNKSEQASITTESTVEITNITDVEILQIIQKLDKELGTENYLPIFHLRQKLQPPLSRDELDKALYRLQADDKIDLGTLQEASAYTPEQIDTGIVQNAGGPLFYITVE
ncbi:MAG: transcription factor RcaD, partial [Rivularia sp. (in: cyanobacteria)]